MDYPVPGVSESDVQRIVEREFAQEVRLKVYNLLNSHENGPGGRRVFCAAMRLANGDIAELERQLKLGMIDFRDVIAPGECPRFWKIGLVGATKLSEGERKKLYFDDYEEYIKWLNK